MGASNIEPVKGRVGDLLRRRTAGLRWRFEMAGNRLFDIRYGVETRLVAGLAEQGVPAAEAVHGNNLYRPIWASEFRHFMRAIDVDPSRYTLVDFGSGKGKLLLLAAEFGFRNIVGVEYAPGLHAIAIENVRKFEARPRRRSAIAAVNADARKFDLPQEPLVMFMFNPFDSEIARSVVIQIENDYRRNPREMYLLYGNRRSVSEIGDAFADARVLRLAKASRQFLLFCARAGESALPRSA